MRNLSPLLSKLPEQPRATVMTCAYGLAGGGIAVGFLLLTNWVYRLTFVALSGRSLWVFLAGSLLVVVISSLAVGWLLFRYSPEAAGSGIPQLKVAYWKDLGWVPWRSTWVKFIAGVLSLGGGASLGREGPTVFIAGGCASAVADRLGVAKHARRASAASGAAAGLAAAFNTPLAAITFVLEELLGELNNRVLGAVVLASVIGAFVVYACVGRQPAFVLPSVDAQSWPSYLLVPPVAAAAAAIGGLYQRQVTRLRRRIRERSRIPNWLKPCVGGLITWAVGVSVFTVTGRLGVFSLGYDDMSAGLHLGLTWQVSALLVASKLLASIMCYAWGGCGGIFSPTLVLGGMTGLCVGGIAGQFIPLTPADRVILGAVGMSACFGAVVRAPLTALLIVFEMTHAFAMVPALMIGAVVSQALARVFGKDNFYDAILLQDGHDSMHIKPPRDLQSWQNLPISAIAKSKPVVLRDLSADSLRTALKHPYERFPVSDDGRVTGIVTRSEMQAALRENRPARSQQAVICSSDQTVRQIGQCIVGSVNGMVVLTDPGTGNVTGLVTLHDLLRAQVAVAE